MTKNNLDHASRCVWKLSLDDLSAKRAAMGLGLLEECCHEQPESHPCRLVWSGDDPVFSLKPGDDERVKRATVRGLVAEHNAMPVLIEVARSALRLRAAELAALRARKEARTEGNASGLMKALTEEEMAAYAYDAALAKVTCSVQGVKLADLPEAGPAPQCSSTKTDATRILNLLKAWSLAAFNGGRLDTSSFQEWWARHQDSAEKMSAAGTAAQFAGRSEIAELRASKRKLRDALELEAIQRDEDPE